MTKLRTRVFYCGGTIPVVSHQQKGTIEIKDGSLCLVAKGKSAEQTVDIRIPLANIKNTTPVEKKYYSSIGYFLRIGYIDIRGRDEEIELEIRCFIRRGRTQALMNFWVETLCQRA